MKTVLTAMPYAQATVYRNPNRITLVSYKTTVAEIIGGVLIVYGLYSMTTRRHISAFVREYANTDYAIAKDCYIKGIGYDIVTHQWVEL